LLEKSFDAPVLDRLECLYLALSLYEKPERDSLNATCRDSLLYSLPENRARLVADESVENAACLLCVNLSFVNLTCACNCSLHCILGDFVKEHALHGRAVLATKLTRDMPCNGFAFAIRVCSKQNLTRILRRVLELGESFFFSGNGYVFGLESILDVDADFFL